MEPENNLPSRRKRRSRRAASDEVVDLSSNRTESTETIRLDSEEGAVGEAASTSVAVVDLTKDSHDSSVISVVDLTDGPVVEDVEEVSTITPAKRTRRGRRRSAQQMGSGNSVVISSGEESDNSDLEVLPSPDFLGSRLSGDVASSDSPAKKVIKCPICFDSDEAIKRSGRRIMSTNCGHIFCEDCIKQAIESQHKCPTCRKKLTLRQIHPIFL